MITYRGIEVEIIDVYKQRLDPPFADEHPAYPVEWVYLPLVKTIEGDEVLVPLVSMLEGDREEILTIMSNIMEKKNND